MPSLTPSSRSPWSHRAEQSGRSLTGSTGLALLVALVVSSGACTGDATDDAGIATDDTVPVTPGAPGGADLGEEGPEGEAAGEEAAPVGQAVPRTDIWLGELVGDGDSLRVEDLVNVTRRPSYDNQPAFLPETTGFLYTAVDGTGQADIWRHDLATGQNTRITDTAPESEYSPTPMPGARGFSAVRVEADSTQRLWRFGWDGEGAAVLFPDIEPVGYHAWAGPDYAALFVLGDPPTLQIVEGETGRVQEVARDVGRSLQTIPGEQAVSFVQRVPTADEGPPETRIMRWSPGEGIAPITGGLDGGDDHAWTPDGALLMGRGHQILGWRQGWEEWRVLGMLPEGVTVSRMAVSPDGRHLAVVGNPDGG